MFSYQITELSCIFLHNAYGVFFHIWLSKQSNDCKHIVFNLITSIKTGIVHDGHTPYMVSKAKDFKEKMGLKSNLIICQIESGENARYYRSV